MKYKVFIDTNIVHEKRGVTSFLFNGSLQELNRFLKKNNLLNQVRVCLPEIVVRERIRQKSNLIEKIRESANEKIKSLNEAGYKIDAIIPKDDYATQLRKTANDFLEKNSIDVVPVPQVQQSDLVDRVIEKQKPFKQEESNDSGFKDTLIFLTILEDAKNSDVEEYIFCTANKKDFDADIIQEFKSKTSKEIFIVESVQEVEEFLDDRLSLELDLEERNDEIENIVKNNTGDLVIFLNKNRVSSSAQNNIGLVSPRYSASKGLMLTATDLSSTSVSAVSDLQQNDFSLSPIVSQNELADILGYNLEGFEILSIQESCNDSVYHVEVNVKVLVRRDSNSKTKLVPGMLAFSGSEVSFHNLSYEYKDFVFSLECNFLSKEVKILSCSR